MKKYALYPGVGKLNPSDSKPRYISAQLLASYCYRVPMSECINMEDPAIKKMASIGAKFDNLIHLIPRNDGVYEIPSRETNKKIVALGLNEQVKTDG